MPATHKRARYSQLSADELKVLEGHVGPGWLPQWVCNKSAFWFKKLFQMAVQTRHDFGYIVGGDYYFRFVCDTKLIENMREDSNRHSGWKSLLTRYVGDLIYITVRIFGWLSYQERKQSLTQKEVSEELLQRKAELETGKEDIRKWFIFLFMLIPLTLFTLVNLAAYLVILLFYKDEQTGTKIKACGLLLATLLGLKLVLSFCGSVACFIYNLIV